MILLRDLYFGCLKEIYMLKYLTVVDLDSRYLCR